jgi:hypothetical protein
MALFGKKKNSNEQPVYIPIDKLKGYIEVLSEGQTQAQQIAWNLVLAEIAKAPVADMSIEELSKVIDSLVGYTDGQKQTLKNRLTLINSMIEKYGNSKNTELEPQLDIPPLPPLPPEESRAVPFRPFVQNFVKQETSVQKNISNVSVISELLHQKK